MRKKTKIKTFYLFFILAGVVYVLGLFLDVINVDSAQYASMSFELLEHDNWLFLYERGQDYLDKPPMVFWLCAISYKLFGISAFTYKLPSFMFFILCVYSTFQLGALLYDKKVALLSIVFLLGSIGFIYLNLDVKTDVILCGAVVYSIYQLILFLRLDKIKHLLLASIFIGVGLLTKGVLGLMVPVFAVLPEVIYQKKWKRLFDIRLLIGLFIITAMLVPMCIGLYEQFDLHPEKLVNGKKGVSGLYFYFWEQGFGRITGENKWKNDTGYLYFFHTMLLFALPWSLILLIAFVEKCKSLIRRVSQKEILTFTGVLLTVVALSFSKYKLPHYIFVIFPLAAIFSASIYFKVIKQNRIFLAINSLSIIFCSLFLLASVLSFLLFKSKNIMAVCLVVLSWVCIGVVYAKFKNKLLRPILLPSLATLVFGITMNIHLVPTLLSFQAEPKISDHVKMKNINPDNVYFYDRNSRRLEFNLRQRIDVLSSEKINTKVKKEEKMFLITSEEGEKYIRKKGFKIKSVYSFDHIGLNRFSIDFFNPKTRSSTFEKRYMIEL